jgi:hypothetical protein
VLAAIIVISSIALGLGVAHAEDAPSWTLTPSGTTVPGQPARSVVAFSASPGEQFSDSVTLHNPTNVPVQIQLFSSDAYTTRAGGGFALNTAPRTSHDLGSWITLPVVQFSAPAQADVKIPFTVDVPANASPGDHSGGVVALGTAPVSVHTKNGVDVQVKRAVGTRVYIRVKGPERPGLDIPSLQLDAPTNVLSPIVGSGTTTVTFTLANTGNTRLSPKIHVWLTDALGRTVKSFPDARLIDFLPGNQVVLTRSWSSGARLPIRLTAHVEASAGTTGASASTSEIVIPWLMLVAIAIAVGVVIWWWRRRRRRAPDPYAGIAGG